MSCALISRPDSLDSHSPVCVILLSVGSCSSSVSASLVLSPSLPPQFPLYLMGQGIAARLTQGGLAQVFFAALAAYIDKICLSLTSPAISRLIGMNKTRLQFSAFPSPVGADSSLRCVTQITVFCFLVFNSNVIDGGYCGNCVTVLLKLILSLGRICSHMKNRHKDRHDVILDITKNITK